MDKGGDKQVTMEEFTIATKKDLSQTMLFPLGGQTKRDLFSFKEYLMGVPNDHA